MMRTYGLRSTCALGPQYANHTLYICSYGARIDATGSHGFSCSLGFGRIARHSWSTINEIIHRSLSKASIKEPPGLLRTDGRKPDGLTMNPWHAGRHPVWDAMVVDTLA